MSSGPEALPNGRQPRTDLTSSLVKTRFERHVLFSGKVGMVALSAFKLVWFAKNSLRRSALSESSDAHLSL